MTVEYTQAVSDSIKARFVELKATGADYDTRTALVQDIADELTATMKVEVSEASVRSKLVSMKVYVGKAKKESEVGATSKEAYVKALGAIVGTSVTSFEKATKADLKAVVDYITAASAARAADEGVDELKVLQDA
jgi:hypothetical protein